MRRVFRHAIQSIEDQTNLTLIEFWKQFNILNAVEHIAEAWQEVKTETMSSCWKKIIPVYFDDTFETQSNDMVEECVELANQLEIEVNLDEMKQLIIEAAEPLSNDELIKLETLEVLEEYLENDEESSDEETDKKSFKTNKLAEAFSYMEKALAEIEKMDENEERFSKVSRNIRNEMAVYKQIYKDKISSTKQLTMDSFIKKNIH